MRKVSVEDAVGMVLCHDITRIIPGAFKGRAFKKGHIVTAEDIPVMPGAMFMVAYVEETPVLGLPGCVMVAKNTVFDLILPRILAGERIARRDITVLGHGGLCAGCSPYRFPSCPLGKV